MKINLVIAVLFIIINKLSLAQQSIFPKGEIGKNTNNYTGTIWLSELNHPDTIFNLGLGSSSVCTCI